MGHFPQPTPAAGAKLVKSTFIHDEKQDLYDSSSAMSAAWNRCIFCDGYTNPFNYPDFLVQRSGINGAVSFEGSSSVSIGLEHLNSMIMVDRLDNRTGKDIAAVTAYNFWGKAQPKDEDSQEIYPMTPVAQGAATVWMMPMTSLPDNTLNQFKVTFTDNEEVIVPVEKPEWDKSDTEGAEVSKACVYRVSLVIDNDAAACVATVR